MANETKENKKIIKKDEIWYVPVKILDETRDDYSGDVLACLVSADGREMRDQEDLLLDAGLFPFERKFVAFSEKDVEVG